jgi:hypothetical protein
MAYRAGASKHYGQLVWSIEKRAQTFETDVWRTVIPSGLTWKSTNNPALARTNLGPRARFNRSWLYVFANLVVVSSEREH